jgi:hypothetical protein
MLSGCATMHYPTAYKVEGREVVKFQDLDDDRALKMIALIYNTKKETWEDGIARSIALDEYIKLLAKRKSRYIKESGIFDVKYDKVNVSAWKDDDLVKLYNALLPKAESFYSDTSADLTEMENAERITYLTAMNAITAEFDRRESRQNVVAVASQVLLTALSVALSMI